MSFRFPLDPAFAEFIFAPFHDPEHSSGIPDQIEPGSASGLVRDHSWCWTTLAWENADPARSAFTYRFVAPFSVRHHDTLIVSLSLPVGARVELALLVRGYHRASRWIGGFIGKGHRQELKIPVSRLFPAPRALVGGRQFSGLALRVHTAAGGPGVLAISWAAMRDSALHRRQREQRAHLVPDWSSWVLPQSSWGEVRFERGLLFDADMLAGVRAKKSGDGWREHFRLLEKRAGEYLRRNPEADWGEYLPNHDIRYLREDEQGRTAYHWEALVVGFVGLVNEDRAMMAHALRYLMCMVHTRQWADSAEHRVPSSTWNQRAFMEEMTTTSVALLADWFAFALTAQGKNLVRQALWDKGIAPVRRDLMHHEYMHRMNQGAVFCRANIIGGLYLEGAWPRIAASVDQAHEWMNAVLDHYIRPDGGIHEGVGYLCQTLTACLWAIIAHARARGLDWREQVARRFGNSEAYLRVMAATAPGRAIPAGDCRIEWFSGDAIPILAEVFPGSAYADILRNCLREGWVHELTGTLAKSGGLIGMVYGPAETRESVSVVPEMALLADSGKFSLSGARDGLATRFWASSSYRSATHAHRDHGQFWLEVDGEPVFIDRGMVQYWFTDAHFLSRAWMHNVLTPLAVDGAFVEQSFADADEPMRAERDAGRASVAIAGNGVWRDAMSQYARNFELDLPASVKIVDRGTLLRPGRVAFHLHSPHAFEVVGKRATLVRNGRRIVVEFPWANEVACVQRMADLLRRPVYHLCATSAEQVEFVFETAIVVSIDAA